MTAAEALPNGTLDGAELQNGVHEVLQGDPRKLTMPIKTVQDKYELLPAFLKVKAPALTWVHTISRWLAACACTDDFISSHKFMVGSDADSH